MLSLFSDINIDWGRKLCRSHLLKL
jgi:hypothetical protein